jgi:VWFA-related protein
MTRPALFSSRIQTRYSAFKPYFSCGLLVLSLFAASRQMRADDTPLLKTMGKEVTIPVVIRDKHDKFVTNLTKDDFTLTEDGKPQTIHSFEPATSQPIILGLIIDTSMSQHNNIDQIKATSKHFLEQILTNPQDKAFVLHFDREVELLQDTTAHRDKLLASLDQLSPASSEEPQSSNSDDSDDSHKRWRGPSDVVYDSIYLAANDLMGKQQGRKILVVISEGGDRNSKMSAVSAIEAAQQANTVIYAIYLKGEEQGRDSNNSQDKTGRRRTGGTWPGGGGGWPGSGNPGGSGGGNRTPPVESKRVDGRKTLDHITTKTGGHIFEANKKDNLDRAYSDLAEELHSQFLLTYTPAQSGGGSFHQVSLVPKKKDLSVQIQDGYYPGQ